MARENEKYPGRGDIWRQEWIGQRTIRFQPKFQELLNKQFVAGDVPLEFGAFIDAKYTLILKTKTISTGNPYSPFPYPARLTADAVFVETNNRTNMVAVVKLVNLPGQSGFTGSKYIVIDMCEAYAKAGKELGILICEKIK